MSEQIDHIEEQTPTIRIVFDGAPYVGKTTAAYALSEALGGMTVTPEAESHGRTTWFDWMSYSAGRFEGNPVRVELVTVPGQDDLSDRRRHLLGWGDVVVFVADSSEYAFPASVAKFRELQRDFTVLGAKPVVVIANKRDLIDALPLQQVRSELELDDDVLLVEGIATSGGGIRQAFIHAVRAALYNSTARVEETTADSLLRDMQAALTEDEVVAAPTNAQATVAPLGAALADDTSYDTLAEPVFEEPVAEPAFEEPVFEEPVAQPVFEEPVLAEPVFEEPVAEPVFEEPVLAEPVFEEPVAEPVFEEPVAEPVFEEPVAEPVFEEPVAEPVFEEPLLAEPVFEEPVLAQPVFEEPVLAQPVFEEPVAEPVFEEPAFDASALTGGATEPAPGATAEPEAQELAEDQSTIDHPPLRDVQLNQEGIDDGAAVVILAEHWRMLVAIANGRSELPWNDESDEAAVAAELLAWGLVAGEVAEPSTAA